MPEDKDKSELFIFTDEIGKNSTVNYNLRQELIVTTEDKVRLCLNGHLRSKTEWIGPLGVFITIVLVLLTTDFKPALGVTKDFWAAIFSILAVLSLGFTIKSLYESYTAFNIDMIVRNLKEGSESLIVDKKPAKKS